MTALRFAIEVAEGAGDRVAATLLVGALDVSRGLSRLADNPSARSPTV